MTQAGKAKGRAKVVPKHGAVLFLPFQQRWIEDKSRLKIFEKARQIGLSWTSAYTCVERTAVEGAGFDQWVSSRDEVQARLFLEDCKFFAGLLQMAAEDLGLVVLDQEGKQSGQVLRFANGRRIISMSSNPDAQAGKRGGRVLDEFALHPDPRKLYAIAYPGITWGGNLEIISTHRGADNFFASLVEEARHKGNPKGFSLHRVTLEDAVREGLLYRLQARLPKDHPVQELDEDGYLAYVRAGCADEETWLQEYCCVPADEGAAFITYEMIDRCAYRGLESWELWRPEDAEGSLYVGIDIGRKKDLTVIWVVERVGDVFRTRKVIELSQRTFADQMAIAEVWLRAARRAAIDATGLGMQFAEQARQRFGRKVEEVTFTNAAKEEMAFRVRTTMEEGRVRIPSDAKVQADLRSIRKMTTATGKVRFEGDGSTDGHADRFWGLALALEAGSFRGVGVGAHVI